MLRIASGLGFLCMFFCDLARARPLDNTTSSSITWFPCPSNQTLTFECGNLTVPLDYTDLSAGYLTLSLVRANATKQPSKGSILYNPGGPGATGRSQFLDGGDELFLGITGGQYDLISFDPRGTGITLPFYCYATELERAAAAISQPQSINQSDTALGNTWSYQLSFAENCYTLQNQTGGLLGTAFVARDMMQIVDALGGDGLLYYYGISYGTLLGATVAAMFPDRMGRVVLDGVVNAHEYYSNMPFQQNQAADAALASFFEACAQSPSQCVLASNGSSATTLQANLDQLLETIRIEPIGLGTQLGDIVTYGIVKNCIKSALYSPIIAWPRLAVTLNAVYTRNVTAWRLSSSLLQGLLATDDSVFPNYGVEALQGIRGSETLSRTQDLAGIVPAIDTTLSTSRYISDVSAVPWMFYGAQWLMTAKEIYGGNFQIKTQNPILFVGNPLDPVTPIVSAYNMSSGFEGSVVLQHNGGGHTSIPQPSNCTKSVIAAYFANGTLPAPGTQCNPNQYPFQVPTSSKSTQRFLQMAH